MNVKQGHGGRHDQKAKDDRRGDVIAHSCPLRVSPPLDPHLLNDLASLFARSPYLSGTGGRRAMVRLIAARRPRASPLPLHPARDPLAPEHKSGNRIPFVCERVSHGRSGNDGAGDFPRCRRHHLLHPCRHANANRRQLGRRHVPEALMRMEMSSLVPGAPNGVSRRPARALFETLSGLKKFPTRCRSSSRSPTGDTLSQVPS
jgi:hypothetical protein